MLTVSSSSVCLRVTLYWHIDSEAGVRLCRIALDVEMTSAPGMAGLEIEEQAVSNADGAWLQRARSPPVRLVRTLWIIALDEALRTLRFQEICITLIVSSPYGQMAVYQL